jgi:hypothetical protein
MVLAAFMAALALLPGRASGQKTDTLQIRNGGLVIGEVESLFQGILRYSTDAMGTVEVEWDKVEYLVSDKTFEWELGNVGGRVFRGDEGRRIMFGWAERGPRPGTAVVIRDTVSLERVVGLRRFDERWLDRTDGYIEIGGTLAKANDARTIDVASQARYEGALWSISLSYSAYYQRFGEEDQQTRNTLKGSTSRRVSTRWRGAFDTSTEQNRALSLDLRAQGSVGMLNDLVRAPGRYVQFGAGVNANREEYSDSLGTTTNSLELSLAGNLRRYRFNSPEIDFTVQPVLYRSLTESGRTRFKLDSRLSYELFSDFYVGFRFEGSYDTNPPAEDVEKLDYTLALSLGWSWG